MSERGSATPGDSRDTPKHARAEAYNHVQISLDNTPGEHGTSTPQVGTGRGPAVKLPPRQLPEPKPHPAPSGSSPIEYVVVNPAGPSDNSLFPGTDVDPERAIKVGPISPEEPHISAAPPEPALLDKEYRRRRDEAQEKALAIASAELETAEDRLRKQHDRWRLSKLSDGQVRNALKALGSPAQWQELLNQSGLGGNPDAASAAETIARYVKNLDVSDVREDGDWEQVCGSLNSLRKEIDLVRVHIKVLPQRTIRAYVKAAGSVALATKAGLAALSSSLIMADGKAAVAVISAALGGAITAFTEEVRQEIARRLEKHTIRAQLLREHADLLDAIRDLALSLPGISTDDAALQEAVGSNLLALGFRASRVEQLAAIYWTPEQEHIYREEITSLRPLIDSIPAVSAGASNRDRILLAEALLEKREALEKRGKLIKKTWRNRSRNHQPFTLQPPDAGGHQDTHPDTAADTSSILPASHPQNTHESAGPVTGATQQEPYNWAELDPESIEGPSTPAPRNIRRLSPEIGGVRPPTDGPKDGPGQRGPSRT